MTTTTTTSELAALFIAVAACGPSPPVERPVAPAASVSASAAPAAARTPGPPPMMCGRLVHAETLFLECAEAPPPLGVLPELRGLVVSRARRVDLEGLRDHPNLRVLYIEGGKEVGDVSAIASLRNLERLVVQGPAAAALGPLLAGLPGLRVLAIHPGVGDLAAIATLPALEELTIQWNDAPLDVTPLSGHPRLRKLDLKYSRVTGVAALAMSLSLEELALNLSADTDVGALATLPKLRSLSAHSWTGEGFAGLAALTRLPELSIHDGGGADLRVVGAMRGLERLTLPGVDQRELDVLAGLPVLRELSIESAGTTLDLTALPALESLYVRYPRPPQRDALGKLVALRRFGFHHAEVPMDLGPMVGLEVVDLPALSSVTGLGDLPRLREVHLTGGIGGGGGSLAPLAEVRGLQALGVFMGEYAELSALADLPLSTVSASLGRLDVAGVSRVGALRHLDAWFQEAPGLAEIGRATGLTSLSLHAERFGDLHGLAGLTRLQRLELHGNVRSGEGLAGMRRLEELTIASDKEVDLATLATLPRLKRLRLQRTNPSPGSLSALRRARPGCEVVVTLGPR